MGSGPMRAIYGKEDALRPHPRPGNRPRWPSACWRPASCRTTRSSTYPESDKLDLPAQQDHAAGRSGRQPGRQLQVVARSLETALHKLHELKFDLKQVVSGFGSAPLPPVARTS